MKSFNCNGKYNAMKNHLYFVKYMPKGEEV